MVVKALNIAMALVIVLAQDIYNTECVLSVFISNSGIACFFETFLWSRYIKFDWHRNAINNVKEREYRV